VPDQPAKDDLSEQFLAFVRREGAALREGETLPETLASWQNRKLLLRRQLERSWGSIPKKHCPLESNVLGELKRDGYRVEKLVFQTRPGVLMTANAYVPDGEGRRPAVLCVHGHWKGAKQDPVVQSRCLGLVKLGFFVLVVDAFGAGERGVGKALGEYHGEMTAATLWPTGLALSGLQVYENMRAVDYLQTRGEVDPAAIGITGASGGGNQTMYAGAYDERFGCAVPTCSVGTYQAYLGAACCMCEVVPGALEYTEEWGLLAMVAPRALMVTSATQDAFQFSVGEAAKSIANAKRVFELHGRPDHIRHAVFESAHDYSRPMREAMYGWMTLHLKGQGDGGPIAEPEFQTEDPEELRCYPGETRPDAFVTIPRFAAAEAKRLSGSGEAPDHRERWESEVQMMTDGLERVLGPRPAAAPIEVEESTDNESDDDGNSRLKTRTANNVRTLRFESESGLTIVAKHFKNRGKRLAVLLDLNGMRHAENDSLARILRAGWDLVVADLRATGAAAHPGDAVGHAPDHNTAEWSLWIGRPLLGQWAWDVSRLLDAIKASKSSLPAEVAVVGLGPAGLVALMAAIYDPRITKVAMVSTLVSFISDGPYREQRLGTMVPGILRYAGDVSRLTSLVAPRRLVIAGGAHGDGEAHLGYGEEALAKEFEYTRRVYALLDAEDEFTAFLAPRPHDIVERLA
jgi:dienelactone hydrolase